MIPPHIFAGKVSGLQAASDEAGRTGAWCPDRGDGTYKNPVLFADYSDPDAIRVGDDYWLISSSFSLVPGLPILHSRDLVNWSLVNHALPRLVPEEHYSVPRHGGGVWAPAIRHHAGKFWIFYPDPDFGIYVVTADDPRAAWSEPVMAKCGKGLIDPCPFWDDDGAGYLIHGWAKSRAGINNRLTLHRMDDTSTGIADVGTVIIDGDRMAGWETLEGPKLYKRAGHYYVFAPAGGVKDGYQAVFRARSLYGPYESRIVLAQGSTTINGPHQGAWVDTPSGENWFLHFQELPAYGRVVHLQPLHWQDDGWPVMGVDCDGDGRGEPVRTNRKPAVYSPGTIVPASTDEFDAPRLGRQWQWQANPRPDWASLEARRGSLRLACVPQASRSDTLWTAAHLLLQKFSAPTFVVTTVLEAAFVAEGEMAGLIVFGRDYWWIGLRRVAGGTRLEVRSCMGANKGGVENVIVALPVESNTIELRVVVGAGGRCQFSHRDSAEGFSPVGDEFQAASGHWVGAKVGLFASAPVGSAGSAHADFEWFRVDALE